jgi:hypothetical protein
LLNARPTLTTPTLDNSLQEFEVKISDTKSTSEQGSSVPAAKAGIAPVAYVPFVAAEPKKIIRTLKREESISDQDAAEQIACDTKLAFEKGWLIAGDKRSSNSVEFWMQSMLLHIQSLKRKYDGELDFVSQLDSYASMYWKFVCTRILNVEDWSHAQPLGKILEVVQKEFGSLLSPLGQAVVMLLSKGGGDDNITFPDMALATRTEFFRTTDRVQVTLSHVYSCRSVVEYTLKYSVELVSTLCRIMCWCVYAV